MAYWRALAALGLALALAPSVAAQDVEPGVVRGAVVAMSNGASLVGAQVRLDGTNRSVSTGRLGTFVFPQVDAGTYTLSVRWKNEWYEFVSSFVLQPGQVLDISVVLPVSVSGVEETVVVTAQRAASPLETAPEAVTVLDREALQRYGAQDLTGALRSVPGFHLYSGGGNPNDPALNVRGFTGGGENDYVLVLVDGVRINDINNSRVDWREIPLDDIERVEVVRGPISSLWGDTAAGGVIQIFTTQKSRESGWSAAASGGEFGNASIRGDVRIADGPVLWTLGANYDRGDGFRAQSGWEDFQLKLGVGNERDAPVSWNVDLWVRSDDHDNPGALPDTFEGDARESSFTPFDGLERTRATLSWRERRETGSWVVESRASVRLQVDELTETVLPTLQITGTADDTQRRDFAGIQLWGESLARRSFGAAEDVAVTVGMELYGNDFSSELRPIDPSSGEEGALTADGTGNRVGAALYGQVEKTFGERFAVTGGVRYDGIQDFFDEFISSPPPDDEPYSDAVSPRLGLSYRPVESITVWANAGRSFKAPTPFQRFDQRRFFGQPITNPTLEPQRGDSFSLGYRQVVDGNAQFAATMFAHALEDEIGFDAVTFRTENIARSRHRGYEVEVSGRFLRDFRAEGTYTFNDAQVRVGEDTGNQIEIVPRQVSTVGVSWARGGWAASLFGRDVRGIFLDSANTLPLERYQPVDLKASYRFGFGLVALVEVSNAFDEEYSTWGYVNPLQQLFGGPDSFIYPAPGRAVYAGVRYRTGDR